VRRTGARRPLVVGDRLDTDIEGARRAGADSLLVFTGVTDATALLAAVPVHRPDLIAHDCTGLLVAHPAVTRNGAAWRCGAWVAGPAEGGEALVLSPAGPSADDSDGLDGLRALCVAHWTRHLDDGAPATVVAADEQAERALSRWGLPPGR
jgi:glycerol-1-phosphatase